MAQQYQRSAQQNLFSAIISCILCLVIFSSLRFYAEWFREAQSHTILAGFISSWIFIFGLTSISNVEMVFFGHDFQAKFIPEILFCLALAVSGASVIHRVAATTCILFSGFGLYFINQISADYHNKTVAFETVTSKRSKKNK